MTSIFCRTNKMVDAETTITHSLGTARTVLDLKFKKKKKRDCIDSNNTFYYTTRRCCERRRRRRMLCRFCLRFAVFIFLLFFFSFFYIRYEFSIKAVVSPLLRQNFQRMARYSHLIYSSKTRIFLCGYTYARIFNGLRNVYGFNVAVV